MALMLPTTTSAASAEAPQGTGCSRGGSILGRPLSSWPRAYCPERPSGVRGFQFSLAKHLRVVQQRVVRHHLNHPPEQLSVLLIAQQLTDER